MSLVVLCPSDWRAISNGIEETFDYQDDKKGKHVIEKHALDWFLDFYGEGEHFSVNEF